MADVKVTLKSQVKEVTDEVRHQIAIALEAVGEEAEGYARLNCPVDTGNLQNSIAHRVDPSELLVGIGSNVEYAEPVEFRDIAHRNGQAHFLRDSVSRHSDRYKNIVDAALGALE